jgi:GT2 family glycosyltransferase
MRSVALLVLNYNGATITVEGTSLLDIILPTLLDACDRFSGMAEVVVIDNNSKDHSVAHIAEKYPRVKVYKAGKNDYLFSYNEVVEKNSSDIIMLLNNDMCLTPDALDPIVAAFTDDKVFAVGADVFLSRNGRPSDDPDSRCLRMQWYKGRLFPVDISGMIEHGLPVPHYALGGAVAFDTAKYRELGGLDRIFYPYNFEDSDIAFRAYLKDWKCCIAEGARAYHLGSKTMTTLIKRDTARAVYLMNEYTFIAKNIHRVSLYFQSFLYMPWHMLRFRFGGPLNYAKAVFGFFVKLPVIMQRRASLFKVFRGESDERFFNHDIKGRIRDFMWAKVFTAANEPTKALEIVHQLFYGGGTKNNYIKRQLQALVTEIIVVLFQSNKFKKIVALRKILSKEMLNSHALYTIASSYRMLKSFDKAVTLYEEISNDETADTTIRGLSLYHSACIMNVQNKKERSRELGERCLQFMPEHQKCKELLETVS